MGHGQGSMQQTHAPATMHQGHPPRQEVHAPMSRQPQQPQSSYANADKFFRPEDTADDRLATLATGAPHGTKEREDKRYPRSPTRSGGAAHKAGSAPDAQERESYAHSSSIASSESSLQYNDSNAPTSPAANSERSLQHNDSYASSGRYSVDSNDQDEEGSMSSRNFYFNDGGSGDSPERKNRHQSVQKQVNHDRSAPQSANPRMSSQNRGTARPDHQSSGDGGQSASSGRDNTDATPGFDELTARFAALRNKN